MKATHGSESRPFKKSALPIFDSQKEANAYTKQMGDRYFALTHFLEHILEDCEQEMANGYAHLPSGKLKMQLGIMRRELFDKEDEEEWCSLLWRTLARYSYEDTSTAVDVVRFALLGMGLEWKHKGLLSKDKPVDYKAMLGSLCDWIESRIHLFVHTQFHEFPQMFSGRADDWRLARLWMSALISPDLSKRDSEQLVRALRKILDTNSKRFLYIWKAMYDRERRRWRHPDVDVAVISIWPLVQHYNWTYEDLLKVLDKLLPIPAADNKYPRDCADSLKVHCRTILGLTKTGRGKSVSVGKMPEAWEIALELSQPVLRAADEVLGPIASNRNLKKL